MWDRTVSSSKDAFSSLAYMLTNKACSPLISGTCSSPGLTTWSQKDWQGWVGMLVASLLPGQMARLLGEEDASWRGVTALQRAQSSTEQKCWQLLMHLPERKETILPRKLCIRVCVRFLLSMVSLTRLIKIKGRKTHQKAHIQAQPVNVCFNLLAWKGCTIPKAHAHYQGSCFKMSPLTGNDTAA